MVFRALFPLAIAAILTVPPGSAFAQGESDPASEPLRPSPEGRQALVARSSGSYLGRGSTERTPFMAGLGIAFRLRPLPHFALDFALDGFRGRDFVGAVRTEGGLSVTTQLFFNPEHAYVLYLPAGLFHTWAHVQPIKQPERRYRYVGAFLGLGVERSLAEPWAVFVDAVAFLRGRSDAHADEPEYVDLENGRVTNSSGGALIRVGIAHYF